MAATGAHIWFVLIGLLGGLLFTPLSKVLAQAVGAIDKPGELKVHAKPMPRFGGSAIWAATLLACIAGWIVVSRRGDAGELFPSLTGATLMALMGAIDDIRGLTPKVRLAAGGIVTVGASVVLMGALTVPLWGQAALVVACTLWLLGGANALNMLDGLDGLAAGVSAISAACIGFIALHAGATACAALMLSLAGACLGFLRYNFRPARTFMGDVGSLFLGFALTVAVVLLSREASLPAVIGAMLALGVPVGDMLLAMGRRAINHKPLFQGDRSHSYDQLRDRFGFGVVKTVVIMYVVAALFGILGIGVSLLEPGLALVAAVGVVVLSVGAVLAGGFLRREAVTG